LLQRAGDSLHPMAGANALGVELLAMTGTNTGARSNPWLWIAAVWCAVHALGVSVPDASVLAFVPAVAMAQVLPISLSGLGIREGLLVLLLHPLGVPTGKAIGVGLLWYGMTLIVSLLGAPLFAVGGRYGKPTAGDEAGDEAGDHEGDQDAVPPDTAIAGPTVRP